LNQKVGNATLKISSVVLEQVAMLVLEQVKSAMMTKTDCTLACADFNAR